MDDGVPLLNLSGATFEVLGHEDGSLIDLSQTVPDDLRHLITSDEAAVRRRQARERGKGLTYEAEASGHRWRISVSHATASAAPPHNRFAYTVERLHPEPESEPHPQGRATTAEDLLDVLPDVVVVTDLHGGIVYANRSAIELLGAGSIGDLVGRPIWTFVHPEEHATARREGWLARGGKAVEYVRHRVVRLDGQSIPVETVTRSTHFRGETSIVISAHDLTGLRTMEQALEETQQLFYRAFKMGPLAISVSNLDNGVLLDVNDAFCRLVGRSRGQLLGKRPTDVGLEYDVDRVGEMRQAVARDGEVAEVEIQMVDSEGDTRTLLLSASRIDVQGEPCMLTMTHDITERKRVALALRESEERFRTMADNAPVLIWISGTDKACTYFNERWLEFTGRSMEQEVGGGWAEGVHPDDVDRCIQVYTMAFDRREQFTMEYRLRRHDGVYRWMLDRGVPRFLPDGTFVGYIGSCVDITDRKLAEQKLIHSKEQAEEMTILKSAFLTNMTHEIRTPLTVILGFTSILRQGARKEYQRFVNLIERSGRRLLLMLDSVLDLAQLEAGTLVVEPTRQNIADITHGVVATLVSIAQDKNLTLEFEEPKAAPYAIVDAAVLARVLNNLLDNAIKFTDEGGVRVWLEEDERYVIIQIEDTGIGIDERFLPHVFDAFSQESTGIERTHQGSGLGLTVSKQLLDLLGGKLTLRSTKGEGSLVTVRLPKEP